MKKIVIDNVTIEITDTQLKQIQDYFQKDKIKNIKECKTLDELFTIMNISREELTLFKNDNLSHYQKHINAKAVIFTVSNFLNQGWTPKFDGSQRNYYPWLEYNKRTGRWVWASPAYNDTYSAGPVSYYKDPETAKKAFELLKEEYNIYLNTY